MKKILFILLLTIPFIGLGQGWEKTYGGSDDDMGRSVQQTTDGGYIICGWTRSFGNDVDVYLIKTDGNGDSLWTKTYGDSIFELGSSVQQTTDGGYIICGHKEVGNVPSDVYLIKTDGGGNQQWSQTFGGTSSDQGRSVQQTTDGGYIICGHTYSVGNDVDVYLIKTDFLGNSVWTKTFGGNYKDQGHSVQQTTDGGYIICGWTETIIGGDCDVYLIKTDGSGNQQWSQTFGGPNLDRGYSVQQTTDGGYIVTGNQQSFGNDFGVYLIKTDFLGDSLWTKTFGGTGMGGIGYSVQQTTDGGYIICGLTRLQNSFGVNDVYLIKTDGGGNQQWSQTFGGTSSNDIGHSVQQTTDGGYIICGWTINGYYDVYLIKTDSQGNITSTFNIPTSSSNRKLEKVLDILGRETKLKTNTPFIEIYDDGSTEKKIVVE